LGFLGLWGVVVGVLLWLVVVGVVVVAACTNK